MKTFLQRVPALALLLAATLALSAQPLALQAAAPEWAGGKGKGGDDNGNKGKGRDRPQEGRQDRDSDRGAAQAQSRNSGPSIEIHFDDRRRIAVREYYGEQIRGGNCPPGLAKKNNGCQPPGQAKKWAVGRPLPRDVVYYDVPSSLVVRLGPPPSGHRYVRVAADILLIAVGTSMVVDAIQDLGSM